MVLRIKQVQINTFKRFAHIEFVRFVPLDRYIAKSKSKVKNKAINGWPWRAIAFVFVFGEPLMILVADNSTVYFEYLIGSIVVNSKNASMHNRFANCAFYGEHILK